MIINPSNIIHLRRTGARLNAHSIFPSSSCRPRFAPMYEETPRYIIMFVSLEYRWGSSPCRQKKPIPRVSSVARSLSSLPSVGSGKVSGERCSRGRSSSIDESISKIPLYCMADPEKLATELATCLLNLQHLVFIEDKGISRLSRFILQIASHPSRIGDNFLGEPRRERPSYTPSIVLEMGVYFILDSS